MKRVFVFCIVLVLSLAGCMNDHKGDASDGVGNSETPAVGRGFLEFVQPLNNGLVRLTIKDSFRVYCTTDQSIVNSAIEILSMTNSGAFFTFRDWKESDPEYQTMGDDHVRYSDMCGPSVTRTSGKLLSIKHIYIEPQRAQ